MKIIRQLYDWVLHWAHTPYAVPVLFGLAFVESSVFPIPPDVLLVALCLGRPRQSFYFATVCTVGSVLGGLFGYLIGHQFWHLTSTFFFNYIFSENLFLQVQSIYNKYDFLAIFVSGFTPIPYKVFTIAAGVFNINLFTFTIASICGRSGRFFLVALLIFLFGKKVKDFIDKYFGLLTVAFTVLFLGGFILVKYFISH